ncbi:hypothetical protein TorRG33x02_231400 [Trema orientale]|uniref:Uncharacterized protein n=1 Tax=Trema orientale TaxID=63057 RepID=A0A2P5E646_TREOI|nr:hypothetical protein TorRG33x02_231400 [Trema orientale]
MGELGLNRLRSIGAAMVGNDRRICSPGRWRISPFSTEVFFDLDFEGLFKSRRGSLCFPKDGNFDAERDLRSFVGNTDEAQPRLSSTQALEAALKRRDRTYVTSNFDSIFTHLIRVALKEFNTVLSIAIDQELPLANTCYDTTCNFLIVTTKCR